MPQPRQTGPAATLLVGSTANKPEIGETVPITTRANAEWQVVLSLGQRRRQPGGGETGLPLPDIQAGDLLRGYCELEVTTDAPDARSPGLIGSAYTYDPAVRARLLLASDERAYAAEPGRAVLLDQSSGPCTQAHHHTVLVLEGEKRISRRGLGWAGNSFVNLAISATNRRAQARNQLLLGENEETPVVDQDTGGIRAVRFRPGDTNAISSIAPEVLTQDQASNDIPVSKQPTVIFSQELAALKKDEQLLVQAALVVDAAVTQFKTRVSTRIFLADDPAATEPSGVAERIASWKGHLSKENGANCLPDDGERTLRKVGVLRVLANANRPLFVNLTATSSAPDGPNKTPGTLLPIQAGSFLEVTRYGPGRNG